ncbi:MAG TPA: flavodoxin family protein [Candidatus Nanoarchaeia archaeon]|nr:flavodoxin family protein [Candidatus Nanoarchaeia archaeon]
MNKLLSDNELKQILEVNQQTLNIFKKIQKETIEEANNSNKRSKKIHVIGISGSARDEFDMAQQKSNSEELLETCLQQCKKLGATTELIPLRKYNIQHCKACYSTTNTQCHFYCSCYPKGTKQSDDMTNILYDKIIKADVIIFATPVNNFKMSTLMATFIDRCISLDGSLKPANSKAPKDKELNIKHTKFIELTANNNIPGSGFLKRFTGKVAGVIVTGHEEGASMVISSLFMTLSHFGMLFPPFNNMYAMSSICNSTYKDKKIVVSECYKKEARLLAQNLINAVKISKKCKLTDWKYDYSID